jgi:hypothetical protein
VQRLREFNREHPMIIPALVGIVLYILLFFALWWFIRPDLGDTTQKKDFAQLMAQIAGGLALLFGLYFTWRRVEISQKTLEVQQDQQVTERFTRAIDQLGATDDMGDPRLEIRLGGIYALERIARDSPERDYSTVMEVLTAYVRENAPWPPKEAAKANAVPDEGAERDYSTVMEVLTAYIRKNVPWTPKGAAKANTTPDEGTHQQEAVDQDSKANEQDETPTPHEPRADIKAIVDVLRRREENRMPEERHVPLDLRRAILEGANLTGAILEGANLTGTILRRANLEETNLKEANLRGVYLDGAILRGANFEGAILRGAYLLGVDLDGAYLFRAYLEEANLEGATLERANLERANLDGAILRGANLRGAYLRGAYLFRANLRGANLRGANLEGADLEGAILDH